ncbi:MAG: lipoyl protein ligase domain-containing protein [Acidimicrobiales bacterium]
MPEVAGTPGVFDVEPFRGAGRRVVLREIDQPVLVLGSTQPSTLVDVGRAARRGVEVVRRRSGGAAVLLLPGAQVWADLWLPTGDSLWSAEPRASAVVAGEWWVRALGKLASGTATDGIGGLTVHRGPSIQAPGSDVVCFAGIGPGEVVREGRKVVGLAQWRSREGVLVHGCAYRRWDPDPLLDLLDLAAAARLGLAGSLRSSALGIEELGIGELGIGELGAASWGHPQLVGALPDPPSWEVLQG